MRRGNPDPNLTSVAGLVSFGSFLRELDVDRELAGQFNALKDGGGVVYRMGSQLRLFMDGFVVGAHRVFDFEALSADRLFVHLSGGVVPSIDTLYRDLERFDAEANGRLEGIVAKHGLATLPRKRRQVVHLDVDTTVEPLFGTQEGAVPGPNPRYKGRPSYHPVVARIAETDACVGAKLRPGDTAFGAAEAPLVGRWVDRVRETVGPDAAIYVRMDAAADCFDVLDAIDTRGAFFVVKAHITPDLAGAIYYAKDWRTVDRDADGRPLRQVAEVDFVRGPWRRAGKAFRVVAVRSRDRERGPQRYLWPELDWTVQAYITNDPTSDPDDVARRYDARAGIEPLIAEWKNAWGIGKVSSMGFEANHAAMLLKLLTHNLLRRYVRTKAPALAKFRAAWLRRLLIQVPGRLSMSGRSRRLHLPPRPFPQRLLN